jgi:hypothetical protein
MISPNPSSRYFRQIERQELDFRTSRGLCLLNHTPGEHCGGCVSGGFHETRSTCQPLVVYRTKGLVRHRSVAVLTWQSRVVRAFVQGRSGFEVLEHSRHRHPGVAEHPCAT